MIFKIHKNKGVSLIELMVAVSLGLILILSMLAFYSISLQNVTTHNQSTKEQQSIRTMMNLLAKDIENTAGFECADDADVYHLYNNAISLGVKATVSYKSEAINNIVNIETDAFKSITFIHPINKELLYSSLGMPSNRSINFSPIIVNSGCGQDSSTPMYIGSTTLELFPLKDIQVATNTNATPTDQNIETLIMLSHIQARRKNDNSDEIKLKDSYPNKQYPERDQSPSPYRPIINDGTTLFLSNKNNDENLPFGKVDFNFNLGFAKEDKNAAVPDNNIIDSSKIFTDGGWIDPYQSSENFKAIIGNVTNYPLDAAIMPIDYLHTEKDKENVQYGITDGEAKRYVSFPLSKQAIKRVRAIKFKLKFYEADGTTEKYTITRVVRFNNAHLINLKAEKNKNP